jgi:hypothetical protein
MPATFTLVHRLGQAIPKNSAILAAAEPSAPPAPRQRQRRMGVPRRAGSHREGGLPGTRPTSSWADMVDGRAEGNSHGWTGCTRMAFASIAFSPHRSTRLGDRRRRLGGVAATDCVRNGLHNILLLLPHAVEVPLDQTPAPDYRSHSGDNTTKG